MDRTVIACENPFWTFSLAVYAAPGVADECLELQTTLNIDVNVLLFCAWLGAERKIALSEDDFTAIDACVEQWHETVVRPLRSVRQSMKLHPAISNQDVIDLRKQVAALELRAEQIEQAQLFEMADEIARDHETSLDAIVSNVSSYLRRHGDAADNITVPKRMIAAAAQWRRD